MDTARCSTTGTTYTADRFARLDAATIAELRNQLTCPTCHATAFFRRRTTDGKAACFGSNSHQPACPESRAHPNRTDPDAPQQLASLHTIRVTLPHTPANSSAPTAVGTNRTPAHPDTSATQQALRSRGLHTLLRHIVTEPALTYSDVLVQAAGFPELPAHTFFRRFEQLTPASHNGARRGYWGTIISVRTTPARSRPDHEPTTATDDLWLNSGPPGEPSVIIPANTAAAVLAHAHFDDPEDLVGCYVLVLGECRVSARGKVYITPASHSHIVFRATDQI